MKLFDLLCFGAERKFLMKILVVNAGSSSLKYQLLNMENEEVIAKGNCDRIGIGGHVSAKTGDGRSLEADCDFPTHTYHRRN